MATPGAAQPVRLTTWNVNGALHKKWPAVVGLRPDIAILQEVSELDVSMQASSCWVGNDRHKGIAVVGFNGLEVKIHPTWNPSIEFVVPIEVSGPFEFLVLAVWVMRNRAVNRVQESPNRWQMLQALDAYEGLLASRPSIVAGDFNNAIRWDVTGKPDNHSNAVRKLTELGLASAYHTKWAVAQGNEEHATLYWTWNRNKPYHIDYIWLPTAWTPGLKAVEIGEFSMRAEGGLSDHVPLTVEVDDSVVGATAPRGVNASRQIDASELQRRF
jgi:exodeoxyribonuclease-3